MKTVVVVGASLAGLRAAETLRGDGYDGRIVLVGAEDQLPYDRPPLSKQLLAGSMAPDACYYDCDQLDVQWALGAAATGLDVERRVVSLTGGEELGYDG
ncbi:MAG: FAD-dependent oxidoreductase, partial [Acidimicrobiia bacterium]|nr:FAD-dependent oxidoreductase [Acidimicrobiia bacterium]